MFFCKDLLVIPHPVSKASSYEHFILLFNGVEFLLSHLHDTTTFHRRPTLRGFYHISGNISTSIMKVLEQSYDSIASLEYYDLVFYTVSVVVVYVSMVLRRKFMFN